MGNRGCLHDQNGNIVRRYTTKSWVICTIDPIFGVRKLMQPGNYTELFFLDEATALAAGHRPCAQCRREAFRRYQVAWVIAFKLDKDARVWVKDIDAALHGERTSQQAMALPGGEVPDGAIVRRPGRPDPLLVWRGELRPWHFAGYDASIGSPAVEASLEVITPLSNLAVLRAGYRPGIHRTADASID